MPYTCTQHVLTLIELTDSAYNKQKARFFFKDHLYSTS